VPFYNKAVNVGEDQLDRILEVLENDEVIKKYQSLTEDLKSKKNDPKYGAEKWNLE